MAQGLEGFSSPGDENPRRRSGPPEKPDAQAKVAAEMGVSPTAQRPSKRGAEKTPQPQMDKGLRGFVHLLAKTPQECPAVTLACRSILRRTGGDYTLRRSMAMRALNIAGTDT
jgi:hypothetical protein